MASTPPTRVMSQPGIKRDGTMVEGDAYTDGRWCRFRRGLPRKMGGYKALSKQTKGMANALHSYTSNRETYIHAGSVNMLERFKVDGSLNATVVSDRTPTSGFVPDPDNMWTFDVAYETGSGNKLLAHVAPNADCVCNTEGGALFYGDLLSDAPLDPITLPAGFRATGGVISLPPYTVVYGSDGFVGWSAPGKPADYLDTGAGSAFVTRQKIVSARRLRGGPGASPSALLWSAESLIRMYFTGSVATFSFDTIADEITLLGANAIAEYDGVYYWVGNDRFMMFNGVVKEVPNDMNLDFFFNNLNLAKRQTIFTLKVPRHGEIWWCFPKGTSEVPNHAIILNVRDGTWYDTPLPNGGRGAAISPAVATRPFMSGTEQQNAILASATIADGGAGYEVGDVLTLVGGTNVAPAQVSVTSVDEEGAVLTVEIAAGGEYLLTLPGDIDTTGGTGFGAALHADWLRPYKFWAHETGVDEVDGLRVNPVQSYFVTGDISLPMQGAGNSALRVEMVEPDFVQRGPLTVSISGRHNARAPDFSSEPVTFEEEAAGPREQLVALDQQSRILRFRFESNIVGGYYEMGHVLAHLSPGAERMAS